MNKYKISAFVALSLFAGNVTAQEDNKNTLKNSYSMQAFTGVFNTPNAEVINWGDFGFSYSDNYFDHYTNKPTDGFKRSTDLKFGVGILPGLEVVGRLGTEHWDDNCFTEGCGTRDLSGSVKWQIPFIPKDWFSLAIGGQDVGGSIVKSEAYYVTASKKFTFSSIGAIRTSLGVATSDNAIGYMDGAIGSVEYQPFEVLQVAAEYDANAVNVGVKAFAPDSWLPNGWDLYVSAQLYSSDDEHNEKDAWFNFGISVPLGHTETGTNTLKNASNTLALESAALREKSKADSGLGSGILLRSTSSIPGVVRRNDGTSSDDIGSRISMLAQRLEDEGFESVSVGVKYRETNSLKNASNTHSLEFAALRGNSETNSGVNTIETNALKNASDTLELGSAVLRKKSKEDSEVRQNDDNPAVVIRVENNIYNQNEMDAVAVVRHLSLVALGDVQGAVELTNSGVVSYSEALRKGGSVEQSLFDSQYNSKVNWLVKNESSTHFTPRLILAPEVKSLVGTEYGAYDYEVAISSRLQMSLWAGGLIEVRHLSDSVANSDDFDDGEYYQVKYGLDEGIDTRLFHQTFVLPFNLFTKFSYGRIYGEHDGLLNETRWADKTNTHRVTTLVGDYENDIWVWGGKKTLKHQPKLVKYRYRYHPLNWDIELTAGEYWHGDKGFTLRSLHWFNNVQVGVRYKRTKFDDADGGEEEDFLALGFSIPLSFGKSMKPYYGVQVMGTEQWDYYVETSLTEENSGNTIKSGFGKEPSLYHNLNRAYFNRDRL